MPSRAAHAQKADEFLAVIIDVSASMCVRGYKTRAVDAIQTMLLQKLLFAKHDKVLIILAGTEDADNHLRPSGAGGGVGEDGAYDHIVELPDGAASAFHTVSVATLRSLNLLPDSTATADLFDALVVAVSRLNDAPGYEVGKGRVLLVTDGAAAVAQGGVAGGPVDADALHRTEALMLDRGIHLNVLHFDESWGGKGDSGGGPLHVLREMVGRVGGGMDTVSDVVAALASLHTIRKRPATVYQGVFDMAGVVSIPMHVFNLTQEATMKEVHNITLTKADEVMRGGVEGMGGAPLNDDGQEGAAAATVPAPLSTRSKDIGVVNDRRYLVPDDEGRMEEVTPSELGKAYAYGRQMIRVSEAEAGELLRWSHPKHCSLLCFVPTAVIPRYMIMDHVSVCMPPPGNAAAAAALAALAQALAVEGKCACVRFQKRSSSGATCGKAELGVLYPALNTMVDAAVESAGGGSGGGAGGGDLSTTHCPLPHYLFPSPTRIDCLLFLPLPWDEDIRPFTFPTLTGVGDRTDPTPAQLAAADALISGMDLMAVPNQAVAGLPTEAVTPSTTFNPQIARFHATLIAKGVDPEAPVPPVPPAVNAYLHPDATVLQRASDAVSTFTTTFGPLLKRAPAAEAVLPRGVRLYSEMTEEEQRVAACVGVKRPVPTGMGSGSGGAVHGFKRSRMAATGDDEDGVDEAAFTAASLLHDQPGSRCPVEVVGSVDPISDFFTLIRWKRDVEWHIARGVAGMCDVVSRLARSSATLDKAVDALAALRQGCAETHEDERYNALLMGLKREHGPGSGAAANGTPFWQRVVARSAVHPLTLFSVLDGPSVDTTAEEAERFFTTAALPASVALAPPAPPPTAAPDLYDDME